MQNNIGTVDRYLRLTSGLLALVGATQVKRASTLQTVLSAYGAMKVAEGVTGWCPIMHALGVSTAEQQSSSNQSGRSANKQTQRTQQQEQNTQKHQQHASNQSENGAQAEGRKDDNESSSRPNDSTRPSTYSNGDSRTTEGINTAYH